MSNLTGASATPQPYRNPDTTDKIVRNQQESEKWDDLLAIIYSDQKNSDAFIWSTFNTWSGLRQVNVPCPVDVRLDCYAYWSPIEQQNSNMAIELGIIAVPIVGGNVSVQAPSEIVAAATIPTTGAGANLNYAISVGGTIDVTPGLWGVQAVVLIAGSGSIKLNSSGLKVRRGRRPVT